jgi:hypothetical protein
VTMNRQPNWQQQWMKCFGLVPTWMDISWLMGTFNGLCIAPRNNDFT